MLGQDFLHNILSPLVDDTELGVKNALHFKELISDLLVM